MKSDRKQKWKNVTMTPQNVDLYLQDLYADTKAQYINQGVSFNKDDPYQMGLLRLALLEPSAFSGLCKQLLANHFQNKQSMVQDIRTGYIPPAFIQQPVVEQQPFQTFQPQPLQVQQIEEKQVAIPEATVSTPRQANGAHRQAPDGKRARNKSNPLLS